LIQQQIDAGLREIGDRRPVFSGVADFTLPEKKNQYLGMAKSALVAVTVFSREQGQLPLDAVYVIYDEKQKIKRVALKPLFKKPALTELAPDDPAAKHFGRYRQDLFVMVPLWLLESNGELGVRFADKFEHLSLARTPLAFPHPKFTAHDPKAKDTARLPLDRVIVGSLLKQNYCVTARY
jgi:hypothetical protein